MLVPFKILVFGMLFNEIASVQILTRLVQNIDLTWSFNNDTIAWNHAGAFQEHNKTEEMDDDGNWYATSIFSLGAHTGTHLDAPFHFCGTGWPIDEIPVDRLIAKGAFLDMSEKAKVNGSNTVLLPHHLQNWEVVNGPFEPNTALIIKFNWAQFYYDEIKYFGLNETGHKHFPGLSPEAAQWIVDNGNIVGVGVDTGSVDPGISQDFLAHKIISYNQIYIMENLKILMKLPANKFKLLVMPMKIQGSSGAPLRVIATPN